MVPTRSASQGYYHPELFRNLSETAEKVGWLNSEIETEAWIIDTISVLSDNFPEAILVGGSGVRNHTQQNRLTNDVDFDTRLNSLREVNKRIAIINKQLVGTRNPEERQIGAIIPDSGESARAKFYGVRKLAAYNRWRSSDRAVKIHIMYVPDDIQVYHDSPILPIMSPIKHNYTARTGPKHYLFYRKAKRATNEVRPEDFLDIVFIYETSTVGERTTITDYCRNNNRRDIVLQGLKNILAFEFNRAEIELRLTHVTIPDYDSFVYLAKNLYKDLIVMLS